MSLLSGKPVEFLAEHGQAQDSELQKLCETTNLLIKQFNEAHDFLSTLSKGLLEVDPPPKNLLISPFKRLHANLRHLTWQTKQVAIGDLSQRVDFLGEFSDAFNTMIASLREKREIELALKRSEERLGLAIDGADLGLWDCDIGSGEVVFNKRWAEMLEYEPEEIEPRVRFWHALIHPNDKTDFMEAWESHLKCGTPIFRVEHRVRARSGDWKWILCMGRIVDRDSQGRPSRIAGIFVDITDRKKADEALVQSETRLRTVLEKAPDGIITVDSDGVIESLNPAAERMFGYSAKEVVGREVTLLGVWPYMEKDGRDLTDILESQNLEMVTIGSESLGKRKDLSTFPIEFAVSAMIVGQKRLFVAIVRDITKRKLMEAELVEAKEKAEQASRAKSEFLANMSHEIRTPMNGIVGMTELALNTELTTEQREYLEAVELSADSLLRLINDILDFSKIEAGKLDLIETDFCLRDCIADAMTSLAVQAHGKGLELVYKIPPNMPDAVIGDPGRLRQILINLVGNSIKFTREGEVVVRVETETETSNTVRLHFSVTDTGIGIPVEKRESIFQAFEQADASTTRKYGGTGLGLAIVSQLVRMMGGSIWVESELDRGSTFHFTGEFGLQKQLIQSTAARDTAELLGLPVLLVDDNAINRQILEEMLLHWGMQPTVAESGSSALEIMETACKEGRLFPLVITDCMMPEMDGFELAERINQNPALANPAIIMLTSAGERGHASKCVRVGITAYILKPIKHSDLLLTICTVVQKSPSEVKRPRFITRHSIRECKRKLYILLAEDNPVNQKLAVKVLQKMGHTVSVASNGRAALEYLENGMFDLVLMDVRMPEMDGLGATRAIREREKYTGTHIPILAMTAYAMEEDKGMCLEAGMDGYVSKPINSRELFERIESLTGVPDVPAQPLDMTQILDSLGGDKELLKQAVALFIEDYPKLLGHIREAIGNDDPEALHEAAQALKGLVNRFGAKWAVEAAFDLEMTGKIGEMGVAADKLVILEKALDVVRQEIVARSHEISQ